MKSGFGTPPPLWMKSIKMFFCFFKTSFTTEQHVGLAAKWQAGLATEQ